MPTARDILTNALKELNAIGVADTADGDVATFALGKLNRLLDNLSAEGASLSARSIASYTITPGLQPHTIGLVGATWTGAAPVEILGANLIIGTQRYPIEIRDAAWWLNLADPTQQAAIPTDLRYEPTPWPKGSIYLWPVPTSAYDVELLTRIPFSTMAINDDLDLPFGYEDAITLTLAEEMATPLGMAVSPDLMLRASKARARVQANNVPTPALWNDAPGCSGGGWYDALIGRTRP